MSDHPFTCKLSEEEFAKVVELSDTFGVSKNYIIRLCIQQATKLKADDGFARLLQITNVEVDDA